MPKFLKYLSLGLLALVTLLLAALVIVAVTFNPNDYKSELIQLVKDKTQRTLVIPGEIKLTYYPNLGADLGQIEISERNSAAVFASGESVRLSLAVMPIFSSRFVIDQVALDGLTLNIHRFKDGSNNFDDLMPTAKPGAAEGTAAQTSPRTTSAHPVQLDVGGISVSNASLSYTDEVENNKLQVSNIHLVTGPITDGQKSSLEFSADVNGDKPKLALKVLLKTDFTLEMAQQRYLLTQCDAALSGAAADLSSLQVTLSAPRVEATPSTLKMPALELDTSIKQDQLAASVSLSGALDADLGAKLFRSPKLVLSFNGSNAGQSIKGNLSTQLSADLKSQLIDLSGLTADLELPNPAGGTLAVNAKGKAAVYLDRQVVQVALAGKFDTSVFDAQLGLRQFAQPAYTFDISIDNIDADRYSAKAGTPSATPAATTGAATPATGAQTPLDLTALKSLNATGKLKVGTLKVANIKASGLSLALKAGAGRLDINPLAASLYGGTLAGSLSAITSTPPRFAARQSLRQVNLGPLLKDATGEARVDGKGDVSLDLSAAGATLSELKKSLAGTASLNLKDGAVKGINLAETLRQAKAKIGSLQGKPAPEQGTGSATQQTDFSELTGSFKIANGIARNDDLAAKSPLLRLGGNGDINIGLDRLDYTAKVTIVSSLQGQGGPELQAMKGLTVPVILSGPFSAIGWKIDFSGLASELAKQEVDKQKDALKAKAQTKLDAQTDKLKEQLGNKLKGLFGK
jgi:AsmA protein